VHAGCTIFITYSIHGLHENYKPASSSSHCTAMVFKHVRALRPLPDSGHAQPHLRWALIPVKPSPHSFTDHVNINVTHTRIGRHVKREKK